MVATQMPNLAALVLQAGIFDLKVTFPRLDIGIQETIKLEAGVSDKVFRDRSAQQHLTRLKTPTLILHGEADDRAASTSAQQFGAELERLGVPVRVVVFPGVGHSIPRAIQDAELNPFLERYLKNR